MSPIAPWKIYSPSGSMLNEELDKAADSLFRSHASAIRICARLEKLHADIEDLVDHPHFPENLHMYQYFLDALLEYGHFLEFQSFYRGIQLAQSFMTDADATNSLRYDQLIDFSTAHHLARQAYQRIDARLSQFPSQLLCDIGPLLHSLRQEYLTCVYARCGQYALLGFTSAAQKYMAVSRGYAAFRSQLGRLSRQLNAVFDDLPDVQMPLPWRDSPIRPL